MKLEKEIVNRGFKLMEGSALTICSVVRDCNKGLKKNIAIIEDLRKCFKSSKVVIYENDSIDGTKETLLKWQNETSDVYVITENYRDETIPKDWSSKVNKYYSKYRITKMAYYRNKYMSVINGPDFTENDFIIVVDLDIAGLSLNGIAHSFGLAEKWDVVCANGYSYYPIAQKRYYDTYALVELGDEDKPQTVNSIQQKRSIWSFLKPGLPLIPIYSAYGGLAIYKFAAIAQKKYEILTNDDEQVEVRCEHFALCQVIREAGYNKIYINPNMQLSYQVVTLGLVKKYLKRVLKKIVLL